jgi:hypothetical protein
LLQQLCQDRTPLASSRPFPQDLADRWGIWEVSADHCSASSREGPCEHLVRLNLSGRDVQACYQSRESAIAYQKQALSAALGWPRHALVKEPERNPTWDHPEELEPLKQYTFKMCPRPVSAKDAALSVEQLEEFERRGFLFGIPVLEPLELADVQREFDELLASRTDRAPDDASRFRAAHTLSRPLHQDLVHKLANHRRVLNIVECILGTRFCCWSAHLFCKLPGDPTTQPWHQDAGFWPLSESRALTLWLAFDDVDDSNAALTFVEGSHRLGRLPWQPTGSTHHLLTQEIPDVDLLGRFVSVVLHAGEASIHSDLTVHGSRGNFSGRRRAGLALRFVGTDANCLGPMINGYQMNGGCILPKGQASDPKGHWKSLKKRGGSARPPRRAVGSKENCPM